MAIPAAARPVRCLRLVVVAKNAVLPVHGHEVERQERVKLGREPASPKLLVCRAGPVRHRMLDGAERVQKPEEGGDERERGTVKNRRRLSPVVRNDEHRLFKQPINKPLANVDRLRLVGLATTASAVLAHGGQNASWPWKAAGPRVPASAPLSPRRAARLR